MSEENLQLPNQVIQLPLKEGEVYKNYKELCAKLGEKERGGVARKNQISHWRMYFEFTKKGHSYIIGEIIDNNYKLWNTTKSSAQVKPHSELIQRLLLSLIYDYSKENQFVPDVNDIILSNKLIAEMLAMVNKSYYHYFYKASELAKHLNINSELTQDFYMRVNPMITNDIRTALKQLENRKLIHVETVSVYREYITPKLTGYEKTLLTPSEQKVVLEEKKKRWLEETAEHEKDYYYKYGEYRIASSEILKNILETEYAVLKSMNMHDIQNVVKSGYYFEFQNKVVSHLRSFFGIGYYFKAYKIVFSPNLLQFITQTNGDIIKLQETEEIAMKATLNKIIQENIKNNYKEHRKALHHYLEKGDFFGDYYPMLPYSQKIVHDNKEDDIEKVLQQIIEIKK